MFHHSTFKDFPLNPPLVVNSKNIGVVLYCKLERTLHIFYLHFQYESRMWEPIFLITR